MGGGTRLGADSDGRYDVQPAAARRKISNRSASFAKLQKLASLKGCVDKPPWMAGSTSGTIGRRHLSACYL